MTAIAVPHELKHSTGDMLQTASPEQTCGAEPSGKYLDSVPPAVDVDRETLIWTRGRLFPLDNLGRYFKCPRCGSRQVRIL